MAFTNRQIHLAARPKGLPKESDFALVTTEVPALQDGQFLVRINYVSVDPYMRGLMNEGRSYVNHFNVGDVVLGGAAGTVIDSRHPEYAAGETVLGFWGWQEYAVSDGGGVHRFDASLAPLSTSLGVLGMPGLTAHFGLLDIGRPRAGETVFISGAAGAVGSVAGQIAKIMGCRVAGSAGSAEKVAFLQEIGFDAAFNYKSVLEYPAALREACPAGIDVYFDNVGGALTDAVFTQINPEARIVLCGQIDQYNALAPPQGPRLLWHLIAKRARAEGFLVFQFASRYEEGQRAMARWMAEGRLTWRETIVDGLENTPKAFIGLFKGENVGKSLVRIAEPGG